MFNFLSGDNASVTSRKKKNLWDVSHGPRVGILYRDAFYAQKLIDSGKSLIVTSLLQSVPSVVSRTVSNLSI